MKRKDKHFNPDNLNLQICWDWFNTDDMPTMYNYSLGIAYFQETRKCIVIGLVFININIWW